MRKKTYSLMVLVLSISLQAATQNIPIDSMYVGKYGISPKKNNPYQFKISKLIIPSALIGYGILSISNKSVGNLNFSTNHEIKELKPTPTKFDNYTQYAPAAIVYGLNALGISGKHNFRDRTLILATSQALVAATVTPLKFLTKEERPDGSNFKSFPSGHTTTAFSTAQFMFREYKDKNIWLAISGYPFAAFTGTYRLLNNKHWLGDVVAGAGIGILCTEAAYWLFPYTSKLFGHHSKQTTTNIFPYFGDGSTGIGIVKNL